MGPCVSKPLPIIHVGEWNCQSRTERSLPLQKPATCDIASAPAMCRPRLPMTKHSSPAQESARPQIAVSAEGYETHARADRVFDIEGTDTSVVRWIMRAPDGWRPSAPRDRRGE